MCPVLVDLTAPDSNDDVKTEAMAVSIFFTFKASNQKRFNPTEVFFWVSFQIICKMAPMVGKDVTERLFLPRFCEMCCDCRMFHVRKVGDSRLDSEGS